MGGTGDMAGLAVLRGQAGHGVLGERVAIPQMKCTHPVGSGGKAESVSTERGGSLRLSHNLTHNCLALYCHWRGPAVEVRRYKYGNDNSMGLASCGRMWSGSHPCSVLGWMLGGDCKTVDDQMRGEQVDMELGVCRSAEEHEEKCVIVVACIRA